MNFHTVQEMSQGAHAGTMWKFQDYSVIQILCESTLENLEVLNVQFLPF